VSRAFLASLVGKVLSAEDRFLVPFREAGREAACLALVCMVEVVRKPLVRPVGIINLSSSTSRSHAPTNSTAQCLGL